MGEMGVFFNPPWGPAVIAAQTNGEDIPVHVKGPWRCDLWPWHISHLHIHHRGQRDNRKDREKAMATQG